MSEVTPRASRMPRAPMSGIQSASSTVPKEATAAKARSIPPVRMTNIWPSASSSSGATLSSRPRMLYRLRKFGCRIVMTSTSAMSTASGMSGTIRSRQERPFSGLSARSAAVLGEVAASSVRRFIASHHPLDEIHGLGLVAGVRIEATLDLAVAHHENRVAQGDRLLQRVGEQHDGHALRALLAHEGVDVFLRAHVESAGGVVEDEHLEVGRVEPLGQHDLLLVAATQVADVGALIGGADAQALDPAAR